MRKFLLLILAMFISGCVSTKENVVLMGLDVASALKVKSQTKKSLKVVVSSSVNLSTTMQMSYTENGKIYHFTQSKWQDTPSNMLALNLQKNLRESELFSSVLPSKTRSKSDFVLELSVEEFMQYFTKDGSYIKVSYSLVLVDSATNKVVSSRAFESYKEVLKADAMGGVMAYDEALKELFVKNVAWLSEVVSE